MTMTREKVLQRCTKRWGGSRKSLGVQKALRGRGTYRQPQLGAGGLLTTTWTMVTGFGPLCNLGITQLLSNDREDERARDDWRCIVNWDEVSFYLQRRLTYWWIHWSLIILRGALRITYARRWTWNQWGNCNIKESIDRNEYSVCIVSLYRASKISQT
jgi:hypothetical protein